MGRGINVTNSHTHSTLTQVSVYWRSRRFSVKSHSHKAMVFNTFATRLRETVVYRRLQNTIVDCFSSATKKPKKSSKGSSSDDEDERSNALRAVRESKRPAPGVKENHRSRQNECMHMPGIVINPGIGTSTTAGLTSQAPSLEEDVIPSSYYDFERISDMDINLDDGTTSSPCSTVLSHNLEEDIILSRQYEFVKISGIAVNVESKTITSSEGSGSQTNDDHGDTIPEIIADRWRRGEKIAFGGCGGEILKVKDIGTGEDAVLKAEPQSEFRELQTVPNEIRVYKALQRASQKAYQSFVGFPRMHFHGKIGNSNCFIIDLLGENLEQVLQKSNGTLSENFVLQFGMQALTRIETLHGLGYVHSDIKPENLMTGNNDPDRLYMIDFGLARKFRDERGNHIPKGKAESFRGTSVFASPYVNFGWEHTRRDDLISLGYTVIYLFRRDLPWFNVRESEEEEDNMEVLHPEIETEHEYRELLTGKRKHDIPLSELCHGLPVMEKFFNKVLPLKFETEPNYDDLREVLAAGISDDKNEEESQIEQKPEHVHAI